jgi:hypothetical protein
VNLEETKLFEETTKPNDFESGNRHGAILCLNGELGDTILLLAFPKDKSITKK